MKEIKLNKLILENFKCFQQLEIDFNNGQDLVINGANGTGKTTIMDALNWLLFKKNSHGDQDFSVKPLDKNGNSKKSVVISVYGEFLVNGDLVTFKRTMEEQWTRKTWFKRCNIYWLTHIHMKLMVYLHQVKKHTKKLLQIYVMKHYSD